MPIVPLDAQVMSLNQLQVGRDVAASQNFANHQNVFIQNGVKEHSEENETKVQESEKSKGQKIEDKEGGGAGGEYYGHRKKGSEKDTTEQELDKSFLKDKRLGNIIDVVR